MTDDARSNGVTEGADANAARPPDGASAAARARPDPFDSAAFQAVWEASADAMALSDADGVVLRANPAYFDLYGYGPEEVLGRSFALIFPLEVRSAAEAEYLASGPPGGYRRASRCPSGAPMGSPWSSSHGRPSSGRATARSRCSPSCGM